MKNLNFQSSGFRFWGWCWGCFGCRFGCCTKNLLIQGIATAINFSFLAATGTETGVPENVGIVKRAALAAMGAGEFEKDAPTFVNPGIAVADEFVAGQVAGAGIAITCFFHSRSKTDESTAKFQFRQPTNLLRFGLDSYCLQSLNTSRPKTSCRSHPPSVFDGS